MIYQHRGRKERDVGRVIYGVDDIVLIDIYATVDDVDLVAKALVVEVAVEQVIGGVDDTVLLDIYPTVNDVYLDQGAVEGP